MKGYYEKKRVSNSSLTWFLVSPKYFKAKFDGEIDEKVPSYFQKGQQTHAYILEPKEFDKEYTFLSYETPKSAQQKEFCESFARLRKGKKDEKLVKAYKKAYTTKESDDKILDKAKTLAKNYQSYIKFVKLSPMYTKVLPNSMLFYLNEAKTKLMEHKKARELMFNEQHSLFGNTDKLFIQNEISIYWEDPITGMSCKSMLDRLIIDHDKKEVYMVDLKTTSHLSDFKTKALEYKYNRQLAFYWLALYWYFKNELNLDLGDYNKYTYIVAITSSSPVEVKVFDVSEMTLNQGLRDIEELMPALKWHFDNDKWDYPKSYYDGEGVEKL